MKVRVKSDVREGFVGFFGDKRRRPGDEFEITEVYKTDQAGNQVKENGKPVLISSIEAQFSDRWMEKVEEPVKGSKAKKAE